MRHSAIAFSALLLLSSTAFGLDLQFHQVERKNSLAVTGEMGQFKLEGGSFSGSGLRADFSHSFNRKLDLELFLSSALSTGGGDSVSSSFTGYGGSIYYNLFSECCEFKKTLSLNDIPVLQESQMSRSRFQIGMGLNQYLLNGSEGVYSSSGLSVGVNYLFPVWGFDLKASVRHLEMVSGSNKIKGLFAGFGFVFSI